jgi:hypothetical protein
MSLFNRSAGSFTNERKASGDKGIDKTLPPYLLTDLRSRVSQFFRA